MATKKRLITSALPYVNNVPHLGNIIGCVLSADAFTRYCKIAGHETIFICGTDEYGTTTVTKAKQEGVTPLELCDKYHALHKEIYDWFNIDFSHFGRTSCPEQTQIVQAIFKKLHKNGYITEDTLKQPYCKECSMFLADRYIEGLCPHCGYEKAKGDQCEKCGKLLDPSDLKQAICVSCNNTPEFRETKHLFLDLEMIKEKLEKWVEETSKKGHWTHNALTITKGWIEQGLKKRCITRDLSWGVPVPLEGFEDKVFYVWFDAPIGYISITANKFENWESWWKSPNEVDLYQFMGKDNIPFHTVLFPSSLIGTKENWTLLSTISSTEYLNYEDSKFSKSRGTGVFGDHAMASGIDSDLFRYYLFRNRPEKNDTNFYWQDFMEKVNGEIIANYANLVNRVLQFAVKFFDGKIDHIYQGENSIFTFSEFDTKVKAIITKFEKVELKTALLETLELCSLGNKYFQDNEPWKYIKNDKEKVYEIISSLFGFIRDISILLHPFIPGAVARYFASIQRPVSDIQIATIGNYTNLEKLTISMPNVLFTKLEKEQIETLRTRYSGTQTNDIPSIAFSKLSLKTGVITSIKRHPEADKLYIETIDMGNGETRQIVSGLVPFYGEDELLGKTVIVVANLKPAKLRGVLSEGMILAADDKKLGVEVLFPETQAGEIVYIDGVEPNDETITIDDFVTVPLSIENSKLTSEGKIILAQGKPITTFKIAKGKVR